MRTECKREKLEFQPYGARQVIGELGLRTIVWVGGGKCWIQEPPVMQDKELYEKLLGLSAPWTVQEVDLQMKEMKVTLRLTHQPLWRFRSPECDP